MVRKRDSKKIERASCYAVDGILPRKHRLDLNIAKSFNKNSYMACFNIFDCKSFKN